MEAVILTILFFVLAGLGVGALWFSKDQRGKRRLKGLTSTPIAEVPEGTLVKITGKLRLAGVPELAAPITGRRCVGYVVEVKERSRSGANVNWVSIVTREDAVDFAVEDATGRAWVKAAGAHLVLVRDGHVRAGSLTDHTERAEAFLMQQGTESENALRTKKALRYEEGVLEPGEEVTVLGVARRTLVPESVRRESLVDVTEWLTFDATSEHALTISDDPSTL